MGALSWAAGGRMLERALPFVVVVVVGVGVTDLVSRKNHRTVIGINLLFFLIDWYE